MNAASSLPVSLRPRRRDRPVTCLGDAAELFAGPLSEYSQVIPPEMHRRAGLRKWWEWDYLADTAARSGLLDGNRRAIGLGVGHEPLIFYFARRCAEVTATDLYSSDTDWREARYATFDAIVDTAPVPFPRDRLKLRNADMRDLGVADASYDFAWSCSSIEHVPSLRDLLQVFAEMARVLKPGGLALLTTEFCLSAPPYLLPNLNALDPDLLKRLVGALDAFELLGETDLGYHWAHPANAARSRRYIPAGCEVSASALEANRLRSGHMALFVGASVIAPIAFVLRRRSGTVPGWSDLELDPRIRDFSDAVSAVHHGRPDDAVTRLRPYLESRADASGAQFDLLMARTYVEAMLRQKHPDRALIHRTASSIVDSVTDDPFQDGDCLDMFASALFGCGDYERAARAYRLASASPSSQAGPAVRMAFSYLGAMSKLGRAAEAEPFVIATIRDVVCAGVPLDEFEGALATGGYHAGFGPARWAGFVRRLYGELRQTERARFPNGQILRLTAASIAEWPRRAVRRLLQGARSCS